MVSSGSDGKDVTTDNDTPAHSLLLQRMRPRDSFHSNPSHQEKEAEDSIHRRCFCCSTSCCNFAAGMTAVMTSHFLALLSVVRISKKVIGSVSPLVRCYESKASGIVAGCFFSCRCISSQHCCPNSLAWLTTHHRSML